MRNYLFLLQVYGAGNPWIHNVIKFYGGAENAVEKLIQGDKSVLSPKREPALAAASLERSDKIISDCAQKGIKIVTQDDKGYPELLKNIYNPPTVLFVQGDISGLNGRICLAVVGPRTPDRYAAKLASVICPGLAACEIVLISGLARGIDQAAHIAAVRANQPTAAVLACGIDIEYPANTSRLRHEITDAGGAVVTELLPGTGCRAGYFKYRNRIISGLANGTLVIGANDTSGSMITARHAAEQDRDLFFTVPPDTLNENVKGVIKYLRDGAIPVYDHYDIISEYYDIYGGRLNAAAIDESRLGYLAHDCRVAEKPAEKSAETPAEKSAETPAEKSAETPAEKPAAEEKAEEKEKEEKPSPVSRNYVDMMPKKYKILLGYEKPDGTPINKSGGKTAEPDIPEKASGVFDEAEPDIPEKASGVFDEAEPDIPEKTSGVFDEAEPDIPEKTSGVPDEAEPDGLRGRLTKLLKDSDGGISLDEILREINEDFGDVTETLADMEMDGIISCTAGNIYVLNK